MTQGSHAPVPSQLMASEPSHLGSTYSSIGNPDQQQKSSDQLPQQSGKRDQQPGSTAEPRELEGMRSSFGSPVQQNPHQGPLQLDTSQSGMLLAAGNSLVNPVRRVQPVSLAL